MAKPGFHSRAASTLALNILLNPAVAIANKNPAVPAGVYEPYDPEELCERVNRMDWSESPANIYWAKTAVTPTDAISTAPNGVVLGKIVEDTNTNVHSLAKSYTIIPGRQISVKVVFAPLAGSPTRYGRISVGDSATGLTGIRCLIDLSNGTHSTTPVAVGAATLTSADITPLGNGCYQVDICGIIGNESAVSVIYYIQATGGAYTASYLGAGPTAGIQIGGMQWNYGTPRPYQKVTDWYTEFMAQIGTQAMLFQDMGCNIPCVKPEDPVGCCLDFRFRGQRGPALVQEAFAQVAGTATDNGNGTYSLLASSHGRHRYFQNDLVNGSLYEVIWEVTAIVGTVSVDWCDATPITQVTTTGVKQHITRRDTYDATFRFFDVNTAAGGSCTYRILSVRQVFGIPWTQSSAPSKFLLSARYNCLLHSNDYSNAAWTKTLSPVTATVGPTGQQDAWLITADGTGADAVTQTATAIGTTAQRIVRKVTVKRGNHDWVRYMMVNGAANDGFRAWFNLATGNFGTIQAIGTATLPVATRKDLGNGFYELIMEITLPGGYAPVIYSLTALADNNTNRNGVAGSTRIQCYEDVRTYDDEIKNIPSIQRVGASAADLETKGFPYFFQADGVDDFGVTPSVDGTPYGDLHLFLGITRGSSGMVAESSVSAAANDGATMLLQGFSTSDDYGMRVRNNALTMDIRYTGQSNPQSDVVSSRIKSAGSNRDAIFGTKLKKIYTPTTNSSTNTIAGNFGNYAWYFGRRGGTSLPWKGRYYFMMFIFRDLGADEEKEITNYIHRKMALPFPNS